ncbi:MAG: GNAT family N-acetyltransferase [Flavobacteriales bacterium]|nr:GNAT family N-acetyltransferase [Flavobacteriales bacterium]
MQVIVTVADDSHHKYAEHICQMMGQAAEIKGTGIAKRKPGYIQKKMTEGKAVIALDNDVAIGFCYIESWEGKKYVANSGLIIDPDYRKTGLAKAIKKATFNLSKEKFPNAKLFGITTSMAVMKINSDLGYKPVTFSELTKDEDFWKGCQDCVNYDILKRTNRSMCLCTGMVCNLADVAAPTTEPSSVHTEQISWENFKRFFILRKLRIQRKIEQFPSLKQAFKNEK